MGGRVLTTTFYMRHFVCKKCGRHSFGACEVLSDGSVAPRTCTRCSDVDLSSMPAIHIFKPGYNEKLGRSFSTRRELERYLRQNNLEEVTTKEMMDVMEKQSRAPDTLPTSPDFEHKVNKYLYDLFQKKGREEEMDDG